MSRSRIAEKRLTSWFHTPDPEGITPALSVRDLADAFLEACAHSGLELWISELQFRKILCEYTCALQAAKLAGMHVSGPKRRQPLPPKWTSEIKDAWNDFLNFHVFSDAHWDYIWSSVAISGLLQNSLQWKADIQALLPYYVKYDQELLVENRILFEDEDGGVVAADDYESPAEDGRDW